MRNQRCFQGDKHQRQKNAVPILWNCLLVLFQTSAPGQRAINHTNFHKVVKLFHSKLHWSYQLSRESRQAWQWVVELGGEQGFDLPEWVLLTSAGFSDGPQRLMKKALQLTPGLQPCPFSPPSSCSTARLFAWHQVGTAHLALSDYTSPLNNNLQWAPGARRDDQFSLPFWRLLMFQYGRDAAMFFWLYWLTKE